MTKTYRQIGFLISGVLHLGAAAAIAPILAQHDSDVPVEKVPIKLAMFRELPSTTLPAPAVSPISPVTEAPPDVTSKKHPLASPLNQETKAKPLRKDPPIKSKRPQGLSKPRPKKAIEEIDNKSHPSKAAMASKAVPQRIAAIAHSKAHEPATDHAAVAAAVDRVKARYLRALHERIQQNKFYPRKARRLRISGDVSITFVIEKSGQLSNIRVTQSSGSDLLDEAGRKTLERIRSFRPLPIELGTSNWELEVPISYRLRR